MITAHRLKVHFERDFTLSTFRPQPNPRHTSMPMHIYNWFVQHQWTKLLLDHRCMPNIVHELYFKGLFVEGSDEAPAKIIASIRGVDVVISPDSIQELYELPIVESSYLPHSIGIEESLFIVARSLVGPRLSWGALMSIPLRFLPLDHRVLVSIYHHCIRPGASYYVVTRLYPYFIYAVGVV